ncbi:MAG: hypothetical protein DRO00_01080 [Thermoproteota archaeon]|nr:MAG: hypothetical protein DRO00_01080 [Candidatus Korarchaeota archaeon]
MKLEEDWLYNIIQILKKVMELIHERLAQVIPDIKLLRGLISLRTIVIVLFDLGGLFGLFLLLMLFTRTLRRFFWVVLLVFVFFLGCLLAYYIPFETLFGVGS